MKSNITSIEITLTSRKLKQGLSLLFLINIVMLFGTWLHNSRALQNGPNFLVRFISQFNLGTENVVASWFSSILLLLVALAAACCYLADRRYAPNFLAKVLNHGWIGFVIIFLLLSFDEMGSFHEMIGETQLFRSVGKEVSAGGWFIFYMLVLLVGIFMICFFLAKFLRNKVSLVFAVLGVLLFLSNPIQETYEIDSWRNAPDPSTWNRPMIFLLLEEGSEIFASLFLLVSFTTYLLGASEKYSIPGHPIFTISLPDKKKVVLYASGLIVLAGILMLIVKRNAWSFKDSDGESAQNWFPSVASFIVAIEALYLYYHSRRRYDRPVFAYLSISFFAVLSSAFFGSNMYNYTSPFFHLIHIFLLLGCLLSGFLSLSTLPGNWCRIAISGFVISMVLSFITIDFFSSSWEYLGYSCLCLAIILSYRHSLRVILEKAG